MHGFEAGQVTLAASIAPTTVHDYVRIHEHPNKTCGSQQSSQFLSEGGTLDSGASIHDRLRLKAPSLIT